MFNKIKNFFKKYILCKKNIIVYDEIKTNNIAKSDPIDIPNNSRSRITYDYNYGSRYYN